jgi:predicted aconitase
MYLTKEEETVLNGEEGVELAKAMKLLVTLGDLQGAERFVRINRSQIAGVSYKTVGEPTLEFVETLALKKLAVKTFATLNPSGMDLNRWRSMGISSSFAEKQLKLCKAYQRLGIQPICTCTPYLSGNRPSKGEIVGFSESSAIAFVNSVIGARTNRHGGLDALSAALVGKVPLMGYLKDENRRGNVYVKVNFNLRDEADFAALGYFVGKNIKTGEIPVYDGIKKSSISELKLLGAASAASGSVGMFHVPKITPEAKSVDDAFGGFDPDYKLIVNGRDIWSVYEELSTGKEPDLVAIGCPHCSIQEMREISKQLSGKRIKKGINFWAFTSPNVFDISKKKGYIKNIVSAGGNVFIHTCMVVMPIEEMGFKCVYSNSAKAAFYIPRMTKGKCESRLLSLAECIRLSVKT